MHVLYFSLCSVFDSPSAPHVGVLFPIYICSDGTLSNVFWCSLDPRDLYIIGSGRYPWALRKTSTQFSNWLRTLRVLPRDITSLIVRLVYEQLNLTQTLIVTFSQASLQFQRKTTAYIRQYAKLVQITAGNNMESWEAALSMISECKRLSNLR
jgi:hypothetical protein